MKDENCIFCKLANGDIPTRSIYEDSDFNVILDMSPATKGHALILPKEHAATIYEMDDAILAKAMKLAKKLVVENTPKLGAAGYNLVQNNGECAGQTVPHFHLHMIPRYEADNQKIGWEPTSPTAEELDQVKDLLTK